MFFIRLFGFYLFIFFNFSDTELELWISGDEKRTEHLYLA